MKAFGRRPGLGWLLVMASGLSVICLAHQLPPFIRGTQTSPQPAGSPVPSQTSEPAAASPQPSIAPTWTRVAVPMTTTLPTKAVGPVTMTIVYDNNPLDARLRTAWGFACLVEAGEAAILFDTGGDGPTLLANLTALGYDPGDLDIVVLSHVHSDHTGGLDAILEANDHLTVYVPRSFPAEFKERVGGRARLVEVGGPAEIAEHVFTTGELGGSPPEQSLVIQTSRGRIVMTGCAHPGIVEIVRQAKVHGEVYMIVGGFHLGGRSVAEIQAIIGQLRGLGVQRAAPCHCTGEEAIRLFEDEFGPDFVRAGVGAVISVQP